MSWHKSWTKITLDQIEALELDESTIENATANGVLDETKGQFDKAKGAARKLIQSGVVGNPSTNSFNLGLGGHANKNHEHDPTWAGECITVSVNCYKEY